MAIGGTSEVVGDNREFSVATGGTEVTIYFNGGDTGTKTSVDDTETEKYTKVVRTKRLSILPNKNIYIKSMNGLNFSDPITVIQNKGRIERFDTQLIVKMVIQTVDDDTNIKLRVK